MRSQPNIFPHPLRAQILDEIHARPFEPVRAPACVLKYVFWKTVEIDHRAALATWCDSRNLTAPSEDDRRYSWKDGNAQLIWETHTEFTSLTWYGDPEHVPESDPFSVFGGTAPILGHLINAVRVNVRSFGKNEGDVSALDFHDFDSASVCVSMCSNGAALIATDFRQDEFGLTRFQIVDMGMRANNLGALVRRLGEIETYRTVALLGLPEAQRASPIVGGLENELRQIFTELNTNKNQRENQVLLDQLYRIAMDLEGLTIESQFRFAASRAYLGIVEQRLEAIAETQHLDYVTFEMFLLRRITPALQTCDAVERRQRALADKITRASDLIRTQLDLDLQAQNQGLLKALNERSELQYRLQQTVEGLSVVAISYYAVSLIYYIIKGVPAPFGLSESTLVALTVPLVALTVWYLVRRVRKRHKEIDAANEAEKEKT